MTIPLQAIIAFFVSLVLVLIFTPILIPFLRKLKAGQQIITDMGPTWHKSKQGTPTMGGIIFMFAVIICYLVFAFTYYTGEGTGIPSAGIICLITSFVFALMGFCDDFLKIKKKNNAGLSELQKIILQFVISLAFIIFNAIRTGGSTVIHFDFPFFVDAIGGFSIDLGIFWYVLAMIIMVGFNNAVNITDGLDGLCTSVTIPVAIFFVVISAARGSYDITVLSLALTGALIGFLVFNWHPCKIMMGDTGSMFLGGMVVTIAFSLDMPLVLLLVGIIYLIETFSVIIQRVYFKITHGKRLFKMTPIHHSFEMSGWSEEKICLLFSGITVVACILAVLLLI
ncbi:MAG: phospho-N-acetylmuramoyl-pentapeptide-transferase [Clostridia bacterium]|nr:phospho-N-acetylmuramoyl-pentapeptide-transferase [Clostridia bacterium]